MPAPFPYSPVICEWSRNKTHIEKKSMEVLKPIFCATSLIEIHINSPYQYLLINVNTNYDTVLQALSRT